MAVSQTDYRDQTQAAMPAAASALKVLSGPSQQYLLGTVTLQFGGVLAVTAGVKAVTATVTGAKVGDRIYAHPDSSFPAGFLLGAAFVTAADTVEFRLVVPAIVIGATYSIPITVIAARAS